MPIAWNDDPPSTYALIAQNVATLGPRLGADARARVTPTLDMAVAWHRAIYAGVPLPVPYYAGGFRDSNPKEPELIGYDVLVGSLAGTDHRAVLSELAVYEEAMRILCARLDAAIAAGTPPVNSAGLEAVIRLAAFTHGEWVRIHPFANGNGRIARAWANFVAVRYGLPAFVAIKPRPASLLYGIAAQASMLGNHAPTERLFTAMLRASFPI